MPTVKVKKAIVRALASLTHELGGVGVLSLVARNLLAPTGVDRDHSPIMRPVSPRSPVPLFALPDLVVFPGFPQPLHVFEPRYRQMMDDSLDGGGQIAIGTVLGDDRDLLSDDAPIQPLGCVGTVEHYEKLEDGRYNIVYRGSARALLSETPSERLYRTVTVDVIDDEISEPDEEERFRVRVRSVLGKTTVGSTGVNLDRLDLTQLTDLLIFQLQLPPERVYALYAQCPVGERIEAALTAFERTQSA